MFNITALETHVTEFRNVLSETLAPYDLGVDVSEVESNFFYVRDRFENIIAEGEGFYNGERMGVTLTVSVTGITPRTFHNMSPVSHEFFTVAGAVPFIVCEAVKSDKF